MFNSIKTKMAFFYFVIGLSVIGLFLLIEFFWLSQLLHSIRHRKTVRIRWIAIILLLNFIGAAYYWRLVPRQSCDPDDFARRLNNWLRENNFSLEKSNTLLNSVIPQAKPFLGLWFFLFIAGKLVEIFHIPVSPLVLYPFLGGMLIVHVVILRALVTHWKGNDQIPYFLVYPILQAQKGIRSRKAEQTAEQGMEGDRQQPFQTALSRTPPVVQMMLGDIFFFAGIIMVLTGILFGVTGVFWKAAAGWAIGFVILICSLKINVDAIFFCRPESVFTMLHQYKFFGNAAYLAFLLSIVLFLVVFLTMIVAMTLHPDVF